MAKTRRAQNHARAHQRARDKDNGVGQAVAKVKPPGRRGPKKIGVHGRRSDLYDVCADHQAYVEVQVCHAGSCGRLGFHVAQGVHNSLEA